MGQMIERVARKLFDAQTPVSGKLNPIIFGKNMTWDEVHNHENSEIRQHDCVLLARLAIEAMREPTEAMIAAGAVRWHEPVRYGDARLPYLGDASMICWDRAIDAALKGG